MSEQTQTCIKCNQALPLSWFPTRANGTRRVCYTCYRAYQKAYRHQQRALDQVNIAARKEERVGSPTDEDADWLTRRLCQFPEFLADCLLSVCEADEKRQYGLLLHEALTASDGRPKGYPKNYRWETAFV
jgi:hypothetical protein